MQFPESWLRQFCNPPLTTQQVADALTMIGLEVEDLRAVAPAFTGVVVGQIVQVQAHPNADRLRVCQVDVGQGEPLSIVCGAPNARVGIKVPCAQVGAQLPPSTDGKPFLIKLSQLRGIQSAGMLCSAKELGIDEDATGLLELSPEAPIGEDIRRYLVLDDTLFTLKLTPNLAHCLSVYGVARELSAISGAPLAMPKNNPIVVQLVDKLVVDVQAKDLCGRFSGRILRNINPQAKTPDWMVARLARCGQRSVNALVDISNYVMFELGRPSHIFDLDKIQGNLQVRWGKKGETLALLNGKTIEVDETVGVIADLQGLESLAGIMGGQATAVSDQTRHIYVEAAFWYPDAVIGRSRRFNFSTDAGYRFERGVDPALTVEHIERITQLILEICSTAQTQCGPIDDWNTLPTEAKTVVLRIARANKVVGMPLTLEQCQHALERLDLTVSRDEVGQQLTVTIPSYRFDLQIEEDLIEEVVRMVGYDNLPDVAPSGAIVPRAASESKKTPWVLRRQMAQLGYQETINFSFVSSQLEEDFAGLHRPIALLNPIASHLNVMRTSLIGSLIQVLKYNLDRKASNVRLFELGSVFLRNETIKTTDSSVAGIEQPMRLAGLIYGLDQPLQWGVGARKVDFYDAKADIETLLSTCRGKLTFEVSTHHALHPGRSARVLMNTKEIGVLGELHPLLCQRYELPSAPIVFEFDIDSILVQNVPQAMPIGKAQAIERDIAFLVGESVDYAHIVQVIESIKMNGIQRDVTLFDVYRPQAQGEKQMQKSLALRLVYQGLDETVDIQQVDQDVKSVVEALTKQLAAQLRVQ